MIEDNDQSIPWGFVSVSHPRHLLEAPMRFALTYDDLKWFTKDDLRCDQVYTHIYIFVGGGVKLIRLVAEIEKTINRSYHVPKMMDPYVKSQSQVGRERHNLDAMQNLQVDSNILVHFGVVCGIMWWFMHLVFSLLMFVPPHLSVFLTPSCCPSCQLEYILPTGRSWDPKARAACKNECPRILWQRGLLQELFCKCSWGQN